MSNEEKRVLDKISQEISKITGVQLGEKQRTMVQSRLSRRLRELKTESYEDYWNYLKGSEEELSKLVSLLTTHHTFFFREFVHFEFLQDQLPSLVKIAKAEGRKKIKVWTAASSEGQEAYSLAMLLDEQLKKIDPSMDFEVYGSDVASECVDKANNGVYRWIEVQKIPAHYISNYWSRGKGDIAHFVKAKKVIKEKCKFEIVNLIEFDAKSFREKFDVVFCRNVFIYFESDVVKKITQNLMKCLHPHGFLVTGLSESLCNLDLSIVHHGRSVYGHHAEAKPERRPERTASEPSSPTPPAPISMERPSVVVERKPIRVICVDDSPTVLKVLARILDKDNGFEIAATAKDGLEAMEKMKTGEFDLMTLDIHMPNMTGIEYLEKNFRAGHPPVVMLSSVSADNAEFAYKALEYGAADYVEKPDATRLSECADQIRVKLKSAHANRSSSGRPEMVLQKSFSRQPIITETEKKIRLVFASYRDRQKIWGLAKEFKAPQPPTLILFDGPEELLSPFVDESSAQGQSIEKWESGKDVYPNQIYCASASEFKSAKIQFEQRLTAALVLGEPSKDIYQKITSWKSIYVIGEDRGEGTSAEHQGLCRMAHTVTPFTSFAYESDRIFSEELAKGKAA